MFLKLFLRLPDIRQSVALTNKILLKFMVQKLYRRWIFGKSGHGNDSVVRMERQIWWFLSTVWLKSPWFVEIFVSQDRLQSLFSYVVSCTSSSFKPFFASARKVCLFFYILSFSASLGELDNTWATFCYCYTLIARMESNYWNIQGKTQHVQQSIAFTVRTNTNQKALIGSCRILLAYRLKDSGWIASCTKDHIYETVRRFISKEQRWQISGTSSDAAYKWISCSN